MTTEKGEGTTDQDIGRPGPWREGRYEQDGGSIEESVHTPPGALPDPNAPVSTPVTRKDYELPGEAAHTDRDGDSEPPGGDAG
jgi:hypothetical protein